MTNETLNLSADFTVPRAIAARTVFIAGTKGSGKTYTAGVLAEEMLSAAVHTLILDPLGVWWGLRHDASGGPGGFPIVILGGEHADVPLLPTSGEAVAEFVVKSGQSCILDMSGFGANAEQDRFVTDLLHRLFRLKATDKGSLHLIMDEADMFVPQQALSKTEIPLLGATKTIITKGRSRGLSMTLLTQRPQSISKAAIEEADVVLCHRMQGVNAVKAMKAWTDLYATAEQAETFYDSLPRLSDGECWVWSPQFLKAFRRVKVRRKTTFDSSRTPDPGETVRKPKAAASVDLDKLTAEIRATAEAAKANDPTHLKRQVAELRKQLDNRPEAKPVERVKEVPILGEQHVKRLEGIAVKLQSEGTRMVETGEKMLAEAAAVRQTITSATARLAGQPAPARPVAATRQVTSRPVPVRRAVPVVAGGGSPSGAALPEGERKILTACAQYDDGADREQISILAGYKRSTRDAYVQRLQGRGYVAIQGDRIVATEEGVAALGDSFEPLPTGDELRAYWLNRLPEGERRCLAVLIAHYPEPVDRDAIGEETGYKRSTRDAYLQRLGTRKLVNSTGRGEVSASEILFD